METSLDSTPLTQAKPVKRPASPIGFVQRPLPWILAGVFLVVYAVTLSRWVSYQGLPSLARAAGWEWQIAYHQPLHYLVTYPVRWLPAGLQVMGLNFFAAVCSVLTLTLLARTVAILPYDRTRDQRQLEHNEFSFLSIPAAWLPPVFAVLVCGLQLTFWEHSVVATGEALDLLLFAYCVRCVLEYRIAQRNSWLYKMAAVLGVAMTSNWAMIGFLPAFVIATLWVKKRSFFNVRFLATMAGLGVAGLLVYLFLPAINSSSNLTDQSFWQMLKVNLGFQKSQLFGFPRYVVLLVGLTSLLPVLFIGIKWPNQLGDISAVGNALTNLMTHIIHAVFLGLCIYVTFDPPFSPRKLAFGQPMLPFYYLGALSIGYCAGYFLLVFGQATIKPWHRYRELRTVINKGAVIVVWMAAIAVPAGLVIKNLPEVRKITGPYLAKMADSVVKSLPENGCVIMSDDLSRLYTVREALNRKGTLDRFILIDTASMQIPAYQRHLRSKYGQRWPTQLAERPLNRGIDTMSIIDTIITASRNQRLFYLQPTFGYYLEYFYLEPHNLVYEMKRYPADSFAASTLSADLLKENDLFWREFIRSDLPALRQPKPVAKKGKKAEPERKHAYFPIAVMYSRALTWIGVEAQKAGQLENARDYFSAALELNRENPSAFISLEYNALLREGKTESTRLSEEAIKHLSRYGGNWERVMMANGPVDEPISAYVVAQTFARGRTFRQAAQTLARIQALNPEALQPRIALVGMLVQAGFPDKALRLIEDIRNEPRKTPMPAHTLMTLIQSEAWAHVYKDDLATAENILRAAETKYPGDDTPFSTLIEIYFRINQKAKAEALLQHELTRNADNASALINSAVIKIQRQEYAPAIEMLDRALKAEPNNAYALINRAISNLQLNRLEEAQRDYELILNKQSKVPHSIYYGLGEIAWRKRLPKTALKHYNDYLKVAPRGTAEYEEVEQRVKKLKEGSLEFRPRNA